MIQRRRAERVLHEYREGVLNIVAERLGVTGRTGEQTVGDASGVDVLVA